MHDFFIFKGKFSLGFKIRYISNTYIYIIIFIYHIIFQSAILVIKQLFYDLIILSHYWVNILLIVLKGKPFLTFTISATSVYSRATDDMSRWVFRKDLPNPPRMQS